MKKLLLLTLSALALCGCAGQNNEDSPVYTRGHYAEVVNRTKTHLYCFRSDSGWCDECEHWSEMDLSKDNIISFNMTVMPYPDIWTSGVRHYHYCVVELVR